VTEEEKIKGTPAAGDGDSTDGDPSPATGDRAGFEASIDDAITHAADEATDVWDEDSLRAAGLGDLLDQEAKADEASKAKEAKLAAPRVSTDSNVQLPEADPGKGPDTLPPPPVQGGMSWAITVALAVALGVAVFFLVKMLR